MKNILKKNYATVAIIGLAIISFSGCTKEPSLNHKPTVKVPHNKILDIGETVTLTARVFDQDKEDQLHYLWKISAKPKNSQSTLVNETNKTISFKADEKGTYYLDFIASDARSSSKSKRVTILVNSILGEWRADLAKTKEENQLDDDEKAEVVETLSSHYKFIFLKNGKLEGEDDASWRYNKNGNYQLNESKDIQLTKKNQLFIIDKLNNGKKLKLYYKRALKK